MFDCLVEGLALFSDESFSESHHSVVVRLCVKDSYRTKLSQDSLSSKRLRGLSLANVVRHGGKETS